MSSFDNAISIRPYFKIHEGQMDACKAFLAQFCEKSSSEDKCLYYNFTLKDDVLCCRECYPDSVGVQEHLENVGALIEQFLKIADLTSIEVHGPADELEKVKPALAALDPIYFTCACGSGR